LAGARAQDSSKSPDETKKGDDAKIISALIAQLGDAGFDKREAAAKTLLKIGDAALDQLAKAAKESTDPETRNSAGQLFREISKRLVIQVQSFDGHKGPKQP